MDDIKNQQLVKKCIEFMEKAEDVLECPVCLNNSKHMVQCLTGHHVCTACKKKLDKCPQCQNKFCGTKSFIMEDLMDKFSSIKLSLSDLDESIKKPVIDTGIETYRKLLKRVLLEFHNYSQKNNAFLLFFKNYLQNPAAYNSELDKLLTSQTYELKNLTRILNETEDTLRSLKKK